MNITIQDLVLFSSVLNELQIKEMKNINSLADTNNTFLYKFIKDIRTRLGVKKSKLLYQVLVYSLLFALFNILDTFSDQSFG